MANCKCGGGLALGKNESYVKCKNEDCEAIAFKNSFGITFTVKERVVMLEGEYIYKKGLKSKKKNTTFNSWCFMDFDADEKRISLDFEKEHPPIFKCGCGGDVFDKGKVVECAQCENKSMKKLSGKLLPERALEEVFNNNRSLVAGFHSEKKEKDFDAYIVMGDKGWVVFDFDNDLTDEDIEKEEDIIDDDVDHLLGSSAKEVIEEAEKDEEADDIFDDMDDGEIDPDAAIREA